MMDKSRKAALTAAFLLFICVVYLLAGVFFGFYIPCPFRTLTGLRCPGCGLSHAAAALFSLDIRQAFSYNAMFIPFYSYIAFAVYRYILSESGKKEPLSGKTVERIDIAFLILVISWWIIRNIINV